MLKTRVFELSNGRYENLSELAQAMGISVSQIYRVREGKRSINQKFIIGAMSAFPEYRLDDLFYLTRDSQVIMQPGQEVSADSSVSPNSMLKPHKDLASTHGVANRMRSVEETS